MIHKRTFLMGALLGLAGLVASAAMAAPASVPRPNFVVLLADDLGSHDVGWRGSEIRTPHLDQLAASGAKLERFYVQPVCSPTRAALLTGRYPFRHGLQVGVVRPWAQYGLPLGERTLPQALKEVGYETAIVGKWHLGHFRPEYLPRARGFDHQYGHYNGALDYFTHVRDGGFDWHRDDRESHDEGYSTHLIAREAVRRIQERDHGKPLFLYVAFNGVHAPYQVPESYSDAYPSLKGVRKTYAGMVSAVDEGVGQILNALRNEGLCTNTLVVFFSDNGGPSPGVIISNGSLRAGKATVYEGGVRTCAVAAWEGRIAPGSTVEAPLHVVDWYPTFLKLAGASLRQPLPVDGRDAWPALTRQAASPHREILVNTSPRNGALIRGDWKLVLNGEQTALDGEAGENGSAVPTGAEGKRRGDRAELFDLSRDPGERQDLAAQQPGKVRELRRRYARWAAQAVPPKAQPRAADFRVPKVWGQEGN